MLKTAKPVLYLKAGFVPTVFSAENRPQGFSPAVLTGGTKDGTIKTAEELEAEAARWRYNAMTREQRIEVITRGIRESEPTFSYDTKIEFFKQDYPANDIRSHIDPYTLASILRGRKDFQVFLADCKARDVKPIIRLLSCSTGDTTNTGNCFAQLLANELGIKVIAPTDILYAEVNGEIYVGDYRDGYFRDFIGRK